MTQRYAGQYLKRTHVVTTFWIYDAISLHSACKLPNLRLLRFAMSNLVGMCSARKPLHKSFFGLIYLDYLWAWSYMQYANIWTHETWEEKTRVGSLLYSENTRTVRTFGLPYSKLGIFIYRVGPAIDVRAHGQGLPRFRRVMMSWEDLEFWFTSFCWLVCANIWKADELVRRLLRTMFFSVLC